MNTGVYILNNMIKSGTVKNGMILSGECISPIAMTAVKEINNPYDEQFASLTVGDSGAAIIMDHSPNENEGIHFIDFLTTAYYSELCIAKPSKHSIGPSMYTKSKEMHDEDLIMVWPQFLESTLEDRNTSFNPKDYDYFIFHQVATGAIKAYNDAGEKYFETKMPPNITSVEEFGNTSSTTHYVVLYNALKEKKIQEGSRILMMSSASGIQVGVISFTLGNMEV